MQHTVSFETKSPIVITDSTKWPVYLLIMIQRKQADFVLKECRHILTLKKINKINEYAFRTKTNFFPLNISEKNSNDPYFLVLKHTFLVNPKDCYDPSH